MVKYAQFDEIGLPKAFYVPEIWGYRTMPVYGEKPEATEHNPIPVAPVVGYAPNPECKVPTYAIEITDAQWSEFLENAGQRKWEIDEAGNGQVVAYMPPPVPVDLAAYTANKRWQKEVGGIVINGISIATDDRSKMMISGARVAAEADPNFTTQWKAADGTFVTIDAAAVIAISDTMLAHVSNCFAIEAQVLAGIQNETIKTVEDIDAAFA